MRSKWVALTGVVLVAAAGCSVHPGAAAVVDGRTISQDYLAATLEDFADLGEVSPAQLLNVLVAMEASEEVAVDLGVSVSGADALAELEERGIDISDFSAGGVEVARYIAMVNRVGESEEMNTELDAARRAAAIEINPRYGVLDTETGTIVDATPPWIVTGEPADQEPAGQ